MKQLTKKQFNAYLKKLAELNGVEVQDLSSKVEVAPSVEQKLEENMQLLSAFLQLINFVPVPEQSGEVVGLEAGSTIASTTDTTANERKPTDPTRTPRNRKYFCHQTNYDTALKYSKLDRWAKFKDFQIKVRNVILKRQALDRLMIAFNGIERADNSDRAANPMLQDVNKGWLQKIRNDAPDHAMSEYGSFDHVPVGKGFTYKNLDALVMDGVENLIDEVYQDDDQLVVICGRKLLADKYFNIVNKEQENTESLAAGVIMSKKQIGGLPAMRAPYFPADALLITRLDNLSIYWQEGTRRRHIIDAPQRDQVENYESVNEDFVVEDYECTALIENIKLIDADESDDDNEGE